MVYKYWFRPNPDAYSVRPWTAPASFSHEVGQAQGSNRGNIEVSGTLGMPFPQRLDFAVQGSDFSLKWRTVESEIAAIWGSYGSFQKMNIGIISLLN